jgi:hypothetical protein
VDFGCGRLWKSADPEIYPPRGIATHPVQETQGHTASQQGGNS